MAIDRVAELASKQSDQLQQLTMTKAASRSRGDSVSEPDEAMTQTDHKLAAVVRKDLAIALRDLLQHGLVEVSIVPSSPEMPNLLYLWGDSHF